VQRVAEQLVALEKIMQGGIHVSDLEADVDIHHLQLAPLVHQSSRAFSDDAIKQALELARALDGQHEDVAANHVAAKQVEGGDGHAQGDLARGAYVDVEVLQLEGRGPRDMHVREACLDGDGRRGLAEVNGLQQQGLEARDVQGRDARAEEVAGLVDLLDEAVAEGPGGGGGTVVAGPDGIGEIGGEGIGKSVSRHQGG